MPTGELGSQRLYRVRYQGPEGSGSLRLVLRLADAERFSLAASDTFGRAVWSLAFDAGETLVVEHRAGEYCRTGADVRVPEAALAPLPVAVLPVVLLGLLPVDAPDDGDEIDVLDRTGRRWTARREVGEWVSWTLWAGGEPSLWWARQGDGGVLSYRGGSQFRWRQGGVEALAEGGEILNPPEGYSRVDCETWRLPEPREDQPAPAGDRPSNRRLP